MDPNSQRKLSEIKRELNAIIMELESISRGVRNDFKGIGNIQCANAIDRAVRNYNIAKRKLNNLDTTTVTEGFEYQTGFGGGSGGGGFR